MKKIIFFFLFTLCFCLVLALEPPVATTNVVPQIDYNSPTLDLNNPAADLNLVNWETRSQADIPVSRIHELKPELIKIEEIVDKTKITSVQWFHSDNLNKADDLSKYSHAQTAVVKKHPGFQAINLNSGSTTYNDGVLTNRDVNLNLKDEQFKGSFITALVEGGFSIGKGTSEGKFEHEEKSYDLEEATGPVEVKTPEDSVLSNNAKMETADSEKIASLDDGTEVTKTDEELSIRGVGFASLDEFDQLTALVGSLSENGQVNPGTLQMDAETIQIEDTSLIVENGIVESSSVELTGDVVIMEKPPSIDQGDGGPLALSKEADKLVTRYGEIGSNIVRNGGNMDMLSRAGAAAAIMEVADFTELTAAGGEIVQSVLALVPEGSSLVPLTSLENVRVGISGAGPELIVGEQAGPVDITTKVDPKKLVAGVGFQEDTVDVGLTVTVPYKTGSPETRVVVNTDSTAIAVLQKGKRFGAEIEGKDFSASFVANPGEVEGQGVWKVSKDFNLVASVQSKSNQGMNDVVGTLGLRVW